MSNFKLIEAICKQKGLSISKLAKEVRISYTGMQRIIEDGSTRTETLERIAKVLNIPIAIFFPDDPNFSIFFDDQDRKAIEEQITSNGLDKFRNEILSDLNFIDTDIRGKFMDVDRKISSVSKEHLINLVFVKFLMKGGHEKELDHIHKVVEDKEQIIELLTENIKSLKERIKKESGT